MVKSETRRDAETPRPLCENLRPRLESFNKIRALKTLYQGKRPRDFILRKSEPVSKTVRSETWQWATWYSINIRSNKSRVPKCYAMTTNLRLKKLTCHAYTFERILLYALNQINNFIMVLIEIVGQKNKNPRHWASRPKIQEKHKKMRFRDSLNSHASKMSRLEQKFPRPWIFRVPFATPKGFREMDKNALKNSKVLKFF